MRKIVYKNYLINVKSRPDRLANATERFETLGLDFICVEAITGEELIKSGAELLTRPNMEANWRSIQKVLTIFLASEDDFCFIYEDDVLFSPKFIEFYQNFQTLGFFDFDVLQFGYLLFDGNNDDGKKNKWKSRYSFVTQIIAKILSCLGTNKFFVLIKLSSFLIKIFNIDVENNLRMVELRKSLVLKESLVQGFEPGTHGFIIGRRMANLLVGYNLPMAMSGDLLFMTLGATKKFKIYRLGVPLATQDETIPSVGIHASQLFDLSNLFLK
jgi:GR25 family glycosyltransferase involved in LPS biosynthesis